ncbi:TPA: DUF4238 domain-containing protein [Citrobacter amalonaticus]|nr:DUF4238 domain-containing protein [Citrobacter amalonaticus]
MAETLVITGLREYLKKYWWGASGELLKWGVSGGWRAIYKDTNMKDLQAKRKHHYVWAYYLKGWSSDNVNIWYLSKKGKSSFDSVRGIGCENHFYKVGKIQKGDIELMHIWMKDSSDDLRALHLQMIEMVSRIQYKVQILEQLKRKRSDIDINELIASNLFENYMSSQENNTVGVLRSLRDGDSSCLDEKEIRWDFSYYLGYQFSRTKRMRDALLYSTINSPSDESVKKRWLDFYTNHWWFMCAFFGTNFAKDIALNTNRKIKLLTNYTNEPFITSDQPVVNINPEGKDGTDVDYYYPVSDKRALLILNSGLVDYDEEMVKMDDVTHLNKIIAGFAGDTIFSNNKELIQKYKKDFDEREFKFS